jgi:hypothetical protein
VEIDHRVSRRYEVIDEDARLWQPGKGDLVRLRTWDIFGVGDPADGVSGDLGAVDLRQMRLVTPPGAQGLLAMASSDPEWVSAGA